MSQSKDVVINVQALDGLWESIGVDRSPGIGPESVEFSHNQWGSDQASFQLRRDPRVVWPDLRAWTAIEIEVGGVLVWSGRVKETPSRDNDFVMNVACEGWQYHLDDHQLQRFYVHTKVSDWRDCRSFLTQPLGNSGGNFAATGNISAESGVAMISWPGNSGAWNQFSKLGVQIDLAAFGSFAKRVVLKWDTSDNDGNVSVVVRGSDAESMNPASGFENAFSVSQNGFGTIRTDSGTFTTARRYVGVFMEAGATHTPTADVWIRLKSIQVFSDAAYESGNASILKASVIFADALNRGTTFIDADQSQIQTPTFSIPDFAPDKPRTPRELIDAGNAWQDWVTQIDVQRRPVFKPKPTAPTLEVGAWSPMEPTDSSQNSGADIYNHVIVAAGATDGSQLRVARAAGKNDPYSRLTVNQQFPLNPLDAGNPWDSGGNQFPNGYPKLVPYMVRIESITISLGGGTVQIWVGEVSSNMVFIGTFPLPYTGPSSYVCWLPDDSTSGFGMRAIYSGTTADAAATITVGVYGGQVGSLAGRQRFARTKTLDIGFTLPTDGVAATQLGDTWIDGHRLTPFKGDVKLTGGQAVRDMLTGVDFPIERLGLRTQELLAFNDRADPDNAGHGRDARMVACKYNVERDEAVVTLDNTRSDFETLLARLAVVTGQGA